ncbi:MAG: DNA gyrase inhibitor YacG [Rhizobiaceae bacterium]|nr:DNA gyrase inhibitor YacG [Rhizobiaceae bacterium]
MTVGQDNVEPLRKPVPCPHCETESSRQHYPFCSRRCADLDLHRWFSQSYAIPAREAGGLAETQDEQ